MAAILRNELETHGPARLRKAERLIPVLNQLIQLGLIVTICYPPQRALYISMAGTDAYGNIVALNNFSLNTTLWATEIMPLNH